MSERSLKGWFKLAFQLLVSEQWDTVKETVEDKDSTYRWLKEQILGEIRKIENKAFRSFLGSAALNIRDRLISLKYVKPDDETFNKVKFWLKHQTGEMVLKDSDNSTDDRVTACKIALLEASFIHFDEPQVVARYFRSLLTKLKDVDGVYAAMEEKNNPSLLTEVKVINDAAKGYILGLCQDLGDWPKFDIPAEAVSDDKPPYKPPEIWCFGDYGMSDGQMSYPEKVAIDKKGQFLVLEEDVIGVGGIVTIQRIQLFNPKGKFLKCLLKRGEGKVNGMADFCLTKDGGILVADKVDGGVGRIQIFDYEGNQLLQIFGQPEDDAAEMSSRFTCITTDPDGRIIAGDISGLCVHVFGADGKRIYKFGKFGRNEGEFHTINNVSCDEKGRIYVTDSALNKIQVFDAEGNFLSTFGPNGTNLRYMLFDADKKEVYGADYDNHKIRVFSMDGEPLREHGKYGTALNECWFPYGLAQFPDGRIAIAERENHRITVLKI